MSIACAEPFVILSLPFLSYLPQFLIDFLPQVSDISQVTQAQPPPTQTPPFPPTGWIVFTGTIPARKAAKDNKPKS